MNLRPHRKESPELNLTPLIDVVFLLLIFFVCTPTFQILERILPSSIVSTEGSTEEIEVDPELVDLERIVVKDWVCVRSKLLALEIKAIDF